jgi:transposase
LVKWIDEEVSRLNWDNPQLKAHLLTHPEFQPRRLFKLLTTAYLTAIFESEEIEDRCYTDPLLRDICGRQAAPQRQSIGRFRRDNRGLLRWLMEQVLTRTMRTHFEVETGRLPAGLKRYLHENATERLELARHLDRAAQGA